MINNNIIVSKPTSIVYTAESQGIAHQDLNYFKDVTSQVAPRSLRLTSKIPTRWRTTIQRQRSESTNNASVIIVGGTWQRGDTILEMVSGDAISVTAGSNSYPIQILEFDDTDFVPGAVDGATSKVSIVVTLSNIHSRDDIPSFKDPIDAIGEDACDKINNPDKYFILKMPEWRRSRTYNDIEQKGYDNYKIISEVSLLKVDGEIQILSIKQFENDNFQDNITCRTNYIKPNEIIIYNPNTLEIQITQFNPYITNLGNNLSDYTNMGYAKIGEPGASTILQLSATDMDQYIYVYKNSESPEISTYEGDVNLNVSANPWVFALSAARILSHISLEYDNNYEQWYPEYYNKLTDNTTFYTITGLSGVDTYGLGCQITDHISLNCVPLASAVELSGTIWEDKLGKAQDYNWHYPYDDIITEVSGNDLFMVRLDDTDDSAWPSASRGSKKYITWKTMVSAMVKSISGLSSDICLDDLSLNWVPETIEISGLGDIIGITDISSVPMSSTRWADSIGCAQDWNWHFPYYNMIPDVSANDMIMIRLGPSGQNIFNYGTSADEYRYGDKKYIFADNFWRNSNNCIIVRPTDNFVTKYQEAVATSPVAANRTTLLVHPGTYSIQGVPLSANTDYIDIISLSRESDVKITGEGIELIANNMNVCGLRSESFSKQTLFFHHNKPNQIFSKLFIEEVYGEYPFAGKTFAGTIYDSTINQGFGGTSGSPSKITGTFYRVNSNKGMGGFTYNFYNCELAGKFYECHFEDDYIAYGQPVNAYFYDCYLGAYFAYGDSISVGGGFYNCIIGGSFCEDVSAVNIQMDSCIVGGNAFSGVKIMEGQISNSKFGSLFPSIAQTSNNVILTNCIITGTTNHQAYKSAGQTFVNCKFGGIFYGGNHPDNYWEGNCVGCTFDSTYANVFYGGSFRGGSYINCINSSGDQFNNNELMRYNATTAGQKLLIAPDPSTTVGVVSASCELHVNGDIRGAYRSTDDSEGQSGTITVLTGVRDQGSGPEIKSRSLTFKDGIITVIGAETDWT
jgi:hypothetical protein